MGYRAKRIDANQNEIVKALRDNGASVLILSMVGKGCPDILMGYGGRNYLIEIKNGTLPLSAQKLTPLESQFVKDWKGQTCVIRSVEDALSFLNNYAKRIYQNGNF